MKTLNITLPIHMKAALDSSLAVFSDDGFKYDITDRQERGNHIYLSLNANDQEIINLGIKIGYALAKKPIQ